ncbi:MAG: hypothetical protein SNJ78_05535 [Spirochaetales bacterium]
MEQLRSVNLIGSYVPHRCGIATFTADLCRSLQKEYSDIPIRVVAMNDTPEGNPYPDEVCFEINQNGIQDYQLASEFLNFKKK